MEPLSTRTSRCPALFLSLSQKATEPRDSLRLIFAGHSGAELTGLHRDAALVAIREDETAQAVGRTHFVSGGQALRCGVTFFPPSLEGVLLCVLQEEALERGKERALANSS